MGLLESMSRDLSKAQRISIGDVRINRLNDALYDQASEEMIQGLMESIKKHGQMENAIGYEDKYDENGDIDGASYTLVGGNTRYLAISKLYEQGEGDGYINMTIIEKPKNHTEELEIMITNNMQRKKTSEERYHEIRVMEHAYEYLDVKPSGTKRDWIGNQLGISGRYVDKLINKFNPKPVEETEEMEQVPSSNEEENVEGQTDIYDFIPEEDDTAGDNEENSMIQEDQEEDIQEHQFTANSNNAPREREMISFIKGNIRSLKRSKEIADEIGYQDSISKELDEIVDQLNEILLSLQSNHSDQ
ncbi:ParB N-terminal domain-containing protein [Faecalibacillus intestinalis]|uniref:ParB N-terminal domain-containing protein n=1 Tax=Faecalibacillus intestinalis TaxID=1982626 RepID=UPI0022E6C814|nr:ParB N-terminal domain-containing protein [Faecalibacillus intestinalis]